jgi:2'-5' RNA ligase
MELVPICIGETELMFRYHPASLGSITPRPTHFISLPLRNKSLNENVLKLHKDLMEISNVPQEALIPTQRLHLTLFVLTLTNDQQIQQACKSLHLFDLVLASILMKFKDYGKIAANVRIRGLALMKGNPKSARVLYGRVNADPSLFKFIKAVQSEFHDNGLVKSLKNPLLHATFMNTKTLSNNINDPVSLNIESVFQKWIDSHFGDIILETCELSRMSQHDENGYKYDGFITFH